MFSLQNRTILIISNEPWGDIWYSKHNWAFELSKRNKIYFINPPKRWSKNDFFKLKVSKNQISENLSIISYANKLPCTRFNFIHDVNERIVVKRLMQFFNSENVTELLFWTFDPFRFTNPMLFNPIKSIYFITDKFQNRLEKNLVNHVDYIISVSPSLSSKYQSKKTLNLTHGISEDEFKVDKVIEIEDYILYVGNIDYRVNYTLLKKLLIRFPDQKFLFIGKVNSNSNANFDELFIKKKYKNLIHKPPIHFKILKNYIAKSKLCLAIMDTKIHGNNINHHKLLQYLAFGKPVLSPVFDDYSDNKDLILGYRTDDEAFYFIKNMIHFNEDQEVILNRVNFAEKHTYTNLIKKIETFLA